LRGPQTKRKAQEVTKMVQKTRICVRYALLGFRNLNHYDLGSFSPKPPKLGVGIGFPMQTKMLNFSKTVTDSAIVCIGANRKPHAASSDPCLHLICVDLETNILSSSVSRHCTMHIAIIYNKRRVVAKRSEKIVHIVRGANRKP